MWKKAILLVISILLARYLLSYLGKSYKNHLPLYLFYFVITFVVIYLLLAKIISLFSPELLENFGDLLEHISTPDQYNTQPAQTMDESIFNTNNVQAATTTVVSSVNDGSNLQAPTDYIDSASPGTTYTDVTYTGYTGTADTGITDTGATNTSYTGYTETVVEYTGYTGSSGTGYETVVLPTEYTGFTGTTIPAYTAYTGYSAAAATVSTTAAKGPTGLSGSELLPYFMGLLSSIATKQPSVNVNVYGTGGGSGVSTVENPNINKYQFDKCMKDASNNESYNFKSRRYNGYDYWKRQMDKDNDYIIMDQDSVDAIYQNPRKSSCPVCPLDINYPFAAYRSGR